MAEENSVAFPEPPKSEQEHLTELVTQEAAAITVSVHKPGFGSQVKPEELGLDDSTIPVFTDPLSGKEVKAMTVGRRKLLYTQDYRMDIFSLLEGRVRELILDNSFPFFSDRLVPNAKWDKVMNGDPSAGMDKNDFAKKPGLVQVGTEFEICAKQFISDYPEIRKIALSDWRKWAENVKRPGTDELLVKDINAFMWAINRKLPSLEKVQKSFSLTWAIRSCTVPEMPEMKIEEAAERKAKIQAYALMEEKYSKEMEQALSGVVQQLREQCAATCTEMLQSMEDGKTPIHQKTINRMVKFIEHFKEMNITQDSSFEQELEQFQEQFLTTTASDYKKNGADAITGFKDALTALKANVEEKIQEDAGEIVASFGQIGKRKISV